MNHFNHKNVQLAYEAVYNQKLCESMEDLGLIDGYDYLDESLSRAFTVGTLSTGGQVGSDIAGIAKGAGSGAGRIARGAGRKVKEAMQRIRPEPQPEPQKEEYELYDTILEYLIQEGYADTLGSAEIILENMSEDWIEEILDEAVNKEDKEEHNVVYDRFGIPHKRNRLRKPTIDEVKEKEFKIKY